jgi:hypothetical protein
MLTVMFDYDARPYPLSEVLFLDTKPSIYSM